MFSALITFTLLWAISCTVIYFLMLKKLDAATRMYEDAKIKRDQAIQDSEAVSLRLKQIEASLNCLN